MAHAEPRHPHQVVHLPRVAEITGLSESTLRYYRLRDRGEGPPTFKIGRRVCAFEDECVAWVETQAAAGREAAPA